MVESCDAFAALGLSVTLRHVEWTAGGGALELHGEPSERRALVVEWEREWRSSSWAVANGGYELARRYVCAEVRNADLPLGVLPGDVAGRFLGALGVPVAVATLTSANVAAYVSAGAREGGLNAAVLVTAGLANALRVGEPSVHPPRRYLPETINLACWLDAPLTFAAHLEAHSIITQARTLEILDARVPSLEQNGWATGTGTDCITLFAPEDSRPAAAYAGMHTSIGRVLGRAVRQATARAVEEWQRAAKSRAERANEK